MITQSDFLFHKKIANCNINAKQLPNLLLHGAIFTNNVKQMLRKYYEMTVAINIVITS